MWENAKQRKEREGKLLCFDCERERASERQKNNQKSLIIKLTRKSREQKSNNWQAEEKKNQIHIVYQLRPIHCFVLCNPISVRRAMSYRIQLLWGHSRC